MNLKMCWGALQKMVDARKRLGLAPANTKKLNGKIRPVIGFGTLTLEVQG